MHLSTISAKVWEAPREEALQGVFLMHICICRHGEAQPYAVTGRDLDRPLSRKGQVQARYLASLLSSGEAAPRVRRVLASPAARTMETAQAIADELGLGITALSELLPANSAGNAISAIERYGEDGAIVVVGHNPTMTATVSVLLHGPSAASAMVGPALKTGHMAVLDVSPNCLPGEGSLLGLHRYEPALTA